MSHSEYSGTGADETSSLYAPLLTEIHTTFGSLVTNHNQIVACQAMRAQQSLQSAEIWHRQHKRMLGQYFANSDRLPHFDLPMVMSMDMSLDNLHDKLQQSDEQLLNREVDMAQRQIEVCGRLMGAVSRMIEKLHADEERHHAEREEQLRDEEELAWQIEVEEFVQAWAVAVRGGGSTDEEMAFWE